MTEMKISGKGPLGPTIAKEASGLHLSAEPPGEEIWGKSVLEMAEEGRMRMLWAPKPHPCSVCGAEGQRWGIICESCRTCPECDSRFTVSYDPANDRAEGPVRTRCMDCLHRWVRGEVEGE